MSVVALSRAKFPTGATSRLKEEFHDAETPVAPVSGIHGHDLTLGTGSYDWVLGGQSRCVIRIVSHKLILNLRSAVMARISIGSPTTSPGAGDPGYYFVRSKRKIVGCQCVVSDEHKDVDRFRGHEAEDTGITSVFLGPRVVAAFGQVNGEISAEFPIRSRIPLCRLCRIIVCGAKLP